MSRLGGECAQGRDHGKSPKRRLHYMFIISTQFIQDSLTTVPRRCINKLPIVIFSSGEIPVLCMRCRIRESCSENLATRLICRIMNKHSRQRTVTGAGIFQAARCHLDVGFSEARAKAVAIGCPRKKLFCFVVCFPWVNGYSISCL